MQKLKTEIDRMREKLAEFDLQDGELSRQIQTLRIEAGARLLEGGDVSKFEAEIGQHELRRTSIQAARTQAQARLADLEAKHKAAGREEAQKRFVELKRDLDDAGVHLQDKIGELFEAATLMDEIFQEARDLQIRWTAPTTALGVWANFLGVPKPSGVLLRNFFEKRFNSGSQEIANIILQADAKRREKVR